jgi:hypothetical protein
MGRKAPCEGSEERRRGTAAATVPNPTPRVSCSAGAERLGAGRYSVEGPKKKLAQCVEVEDAAGVGQHDGGHRGPRNQGRDRELGAGEELIWARKVCSNFALRPFRKYLRRGKCQHFYQMPVCSNINGTS